MNVTISRWGNSLGIRIPKDALQQAGLHEGDVLNVIIEHGNLVLVPQNTEPSLSELIARITPENLHARVFESIEGAEVW